MGAMTARKLAAGIAEISTGKAVNSVTVEELLLYLPMRYEDRSNLARIADLDLVRVRVTLGVAVEELAEERAAGALDLRDEDERLPDGDEVLEARSRDPLVLLALVQPGPRRLSRHAVRAGLH